MAAVQRRIDLLRHLEFFVAVADELHFGRAADAVGVSQPPLSQGLRRLEDRMGTVLFDRGSRGVSLTPAGAALLPLARRVLSDADVLLSAADDVRGEPVGVRLGVPPQMPTEAVAALVTGLRPVLTGRRVDQVTAPTVTLLHSLARGTLDVAVIVHPAPLADLHAGPVVRLQGRLLVASDHPLSRSGAATVPLRRVAAALPLVLAPRRHHPAAHDELLDTAARFGVQISSRTAEDDRAAVLAAASGSVAVLTADSNLASSSVTTLELDGDPLPLRLRMVRPVAPERPLDPSTSRALEEHFLRLGEETR